MYKIILSNTFEKGLKRCKKRGLNLDIIHKALNLLQTTGRLPDTYKPHKLSGNYAGKWEAHIMSDWLIIWEQNDEKLILLMLATGTHSDLF